MKVRYFSVATAALIASQIGCSTETVRTQPLSGNQMYDRQVSGQARARQETDAYNKSANPQGLTYGSTSQNYTGSTSNSTPVVTPSPSSQSSSSHSGSLNTALSALAITGVTAVLAGPTLKNVGGKIMSKLKPKEVTATPKETSGFKNQVISPNDATQKTNPLCASNSQGQNSLEKLKTQVQSIFNQGKQGV
jgi:hypothetical protein